MKLWKLSVLLFLATLLGVAEQSWGQAREDLFSVASHPYGAARFSVNIFGENADNDAAEEAIWDGSDLAGPVRCFDVIGTTAVALYISSDDESDASNGAAPITVTVEALDADWDPVTFTDISLGVASAGGSVFAQIGSVTLMRINRAYVSGTNPALGNIYIGTDTADGDADGIPDTVLTELVAGIVIGNNQTAQGCYTVPNNYNGFLSHFCTTHVDTAANTTMSFALRSSVEGAASRVQESYSLLESVTRCFPNTPPHSPPIMFGEKTDIELTSTAGAANAAASGTFDLVLIDDKKSGL